ncbi:MAG TPA: UDP-3-O-acyl-N-acetylglucosamine deacetylase [Micavibrio sp.]|jgi:UDP-3-O-[3-hydroxymyristoyl] N-acetylglucosamine deacetylase
MQKTLLNDVKCRGIGLHSGEGVTLALRPAPADHGIVFIRTDIKDRDNRIPALYDNVIDTRLCTVIGNEAGVSVGTIEHLMSALCGCGVDNAVIELDGPETPIMDGSSLLFVDMIDEAGLRTQMQPRRAIRVLKEIVIEEGGKIARLSPADGFIFGGEIDFIHPSIGRQSFQTELVNGNFRHDIASARTFGFAKEVEFMRQNGLARGGSLDNAIVLNDTAIMNEGGLRFDDEFIRHKLLDAIGDLYLAGGPILGAYDGSKAGHALNNAVLRKLMATPDAWTRVDLFLDLNEDDRVETEAFSGRATEVIAA